MTAIAKFSLVALDCPHARALAGFYSAITGWPIDGDGEDDWVELRSENGATIAFQEVEDFVAPEWPGAEHPQQAHLDFVVDDLSEGEAAVLAIGARKADVQPNDRWRVFIDPVGHPFCLVTS